MVFINVEHFSLVDLSPWKNWRCNRRQYSSVRLSFSINSVSLILTCIKSSQIPLGLSVSSASNMDQIIQFLLSSLLPSFLHDKKTYTS